MPILKKLRSKIKKKLAARKVKRAVKKKAVNKKPITSRLSKLRRSGETWDAWKKRTGKGHEVKARDKRQAAAKKAKAKAAKLRAKKGLPAATHGRDTKTGKIYNKKALQKKLTAQRLKELRI